MENEEFRIIVETQNCNNDEYKDGFFVFVKSSRSEMSAKLTDLKEYTKNLFSDK